MFLRSESKLALPALHFSEYYHNEGIVARKKAVLKQISRKFFRDFRDIFFARLFDFFACATFNARDFLVVRDF